MARAAALRRATALLLGALLLAAPLRSALADNSDDGDVVVLTAKNFDAVVNKEKIIVRAAPRAARVRRRTRARRGSRLGLCVAAAHR
jgi:hypothetical protein